MRSRSLGLALTAAALLAAAGADVVRTGSNGAELRSTGSTSQKQAQSKQATSFWDERAVFERWWGSNRATRRYPNGPGWTNRHVQRMARKKRNQVRHRKACR